MSPTDSFQLLFALTPSHSTSPHVLLPCILHITAALLQHMAFYTSHTSLTHTFTFLTSHLSLSSLKFCILQMVAVTHTHSLHSALHLHMTYFAQTSDEKKWIMMIKQCSALHAFCYFLPLTFFKLFCIWLNPFPLLSIYFGQSFVIHNWTDSVTE